MDSQGNVSGFSCPSDDSGYTFGGPSSSGGPSSAEEPQAQQGPKVGYPHDSGLTSLVLVLIVTKPNITKSSFFLWL